MKNVSESLAGRIGIVDMLGLSLREICRSRCKKPFLPNEDFLSLSRKENKKVEYKRLWEIIHKGSLPKLYTTNYNDDELRMKRDQNPLAPARLSAP